MVVKVAMPQQFKLKVVPSLKGLLFPNQKEVHYIGGSEVLPPPLFCVAAPRLPEEAAGAWVGFTVPVCAGAAEGFSVSFGSS